MDVFFLCLNQVQEVAEALLPHAEGLLLHAEALLPQLAALLLHVEALPEHIEAEKFFFVLNLPIVPTSPVFMRVEHREVGAPDLPINLPIDLPINLPMYL